MSSERGERLCFKHKKPKRRYRRKADAEQAKQWLIDNRRGDTSRLNIWPCRECGAYHVGNKPRKRKSA